MTDEERNKYAMAAMDMMLASGADMKELAEAKAKWGIGQTDDVEISTCDFSTAFPSLAKAVALCHSKEV